MVKPTREISFEFEKDGFSVINHYSKGSFVRYADMPFIPKVYCFDDLGLEQTPKYYGNECNVMAEILLNRYDLFVSKRMMTHITTNLSASELEIYLRQPDPQPDAGNVQFSGLWQRYKR